MEGKRGVYIDPELHRKLHILAARKGLHMFQITEEAVSEYIGREWNKPQEKK